MEGIRLRKLAVLSFYEHLPGGLELYWDDVEGTEYQHVYKFQWSQRLRELGDVEWEFRKGDHPRYYPPSV